MCTPVGPSLCSHSEEFLTRIRSKSSGGCSDSPAHTARTVSQTGVVVVGMNKRQVMQILLSSGVFPR